MNITSDNLAVAIHDLENLLDEVPASKREFADSLINGKYGYKSRGYLSGKQMEWVETLLGMALVGTPEEDVGGLVGLIELFKKAQENKKYPKLWVALEGSEYQLSIAGAQAKKPGWVNITDGKPYAYNTWFGRVSPEGVWEQPMNLSEEDKKRLSRVLHEFSNNAAEAATKYGHISGHCCFCNSPIGEGEDQTSNDLGYGPVCAKRWGLPWGKKA